MAGISGRFARRGAACVAAACLVAGCSTAGSSSSSSSAVTVSGDTLTIWVSDPPAVQANPALQDAVDAAQLAYRQQSGEVKRYRLRLELFKPKHAKVSAMARTAIQDETAIAYLGEYQPGFSDQTVGITNSQDLLQISPTDTALELGQSTPAVPGSPQYYFESWSTYHRTFARVVPTSAQEAQALVDEMHALGVRSLSLGGDKTDYSEALSDAITADAKAAKIGFTDAAHAQAFLYSGLSPSGAASFFNAMAASHPSAKLFASSAVDSPLFTQALKPAVKNVYVTLPGRMPSAQNAQAQSFDSAFQAKYGTAPSPQAAFGYEAMSALLSVLEHAGAGADNRATVVKDFLSLKRRSSVLGTYSIASNGNTSLDTFVIARLNNGTLTPVRAAPTQG